MRRRQHQSSQGRLNPPIQNVQLVCEVSKYSMPLATRYFTVQEIHHAGIRATRQMTSARFVWENINSDVKLWWEDCTGCQRGKIQRRIKADIQHIQIRFSHIHVNIVGPLPSSNGYRHLFTIKDRSTRWVEAMPLSAMSTKDCVNALLHH